ncbi:MAG TPA: hypothetical protein VMD03_04045 [Steroidobacteraceae bacterium]|nr:hypothetical protein [Steroidobacteraceae bacterium]
MIEKAPFHLKVARLPRHLLKWKSHLESHGVPTDVPLQLGPPGQASLYFNDPFGNHLELECMGFSRAIRDPPPGHGQPRPGSRNPGVSSARSPR